MRRTPASVLLIVAASLVLMAGCKTRSVLNPGGTLPSASLDARAKQIERAARMQDWRTEILAPGVMLATRRMGPHVASSTIRFDETSYSIRLRNSVALRQSEGRVHKTYNAWAMSLAESIRREAADPYPAAVASPPAPEVP